MSIDAYHSIVSGLPEDVVTYMDSFANPETTYYEDRLVDFKRRCKALELENHHVCDCCGPDIMCGYEVFQWWRLRLCPQILSQLPEWIPAIKKAISPIPNPNPNPNRKNGANDLVYYTKCVLEYRWFDKSKTCTFGPFLPPDIQNEIPFLVLICAGFDYTIICRSRLNLKVTFHAEKVVPLDRGGESVFRYTEFTPFSLIDFSQSYKVIYLKPPPLNRRHPVCNKDGLIRYWCVLCVEPTANKFISVHYLDCRNRDRHGSFYMCAACSNINTGNFFYGKNKTFYTRVGMIGTIPDDCIVNCRYY